MRICVFGAGAVGGHIAAKLATGGHDVSVVARGAHLEAIREYGLSLQAGAQTQHARVRASASPADLGVQDAVFVTLKATALPAFGESATPLLGERTPCVFVQNGVPWWYARGLAPSRPAPPDLSRLDPGGALALAVGVQRVVGAVVYSSNDVVRPGVVHNHTPGRNMLVLGEIDDRPSVRVEALRAALEAVELSSPPTTDIRASVWDKLVANLASALCVPVGAPIGALLEDPALAAVRERLRREGAAIAAAHGVDPARAPKRPPGAAPATHKPSMLQDYERGRPMEVEAMLKTPLAFARAAGVEASALETLTAIVARLAAAKGLYA